MPEILFNENFKSVLEHELNNTQGDLQMISAYCKRNALEFVDAKLKALPNLKRLMVRFQPEDILSGATDFEIYEYCKAHGWELYIQLDIHAKTYIFDKKRWIVGSANLTSRGIGLNGNGNIEMSMISDVSDIEYEKINELFSSATIMTDELANLMKAQLSSASTNKKEQKNIGWDTNITQLLNANVKTLFVHDFPQAGSPYPIQSEDALLLGVDSKSTKEQIKHAFTSTRCFKWLINDLQTAPEKQQYFGALTASLHNALVNDPKPYRKEVKELLSNLLNWIQELNIEDIVVDRPNYSQRVNLNYNNKKAD